MDQILQGLPGVVCYTDDILITGKSETEHWKNVEQVLKQLQDRGIMVNKNKRGFGQPSVMCLGHKIDSEGLHPMPEKVEVIANAPVLKNVTELRALLALVIYYGKFISTPIKSMTVLFKKTACRIGPLVAEQPLRGLKHSCHLQRFLLIFILNC